MNTCEACGGAACQHHALLCRALGLSDRRLCFRCLAAALGQGEDAFLSSALGYVLHRDCWLSEWRAIGACALGGGGDRYPCLPPGVPAALAAAAPAPEKRPPADWRHDREFDGGDLACGDLLFDLRLAFADFSPGERVLVTAHDAGAPVDLPAWCRLTGHVLLGADHPHYLVRKHG